MKRAEFLQAVFEYVKTDPEAAPEIVQVCSAGIAESLKKAHVRAADFESALLLSLTNRGEKNNAAIKSLIDKWHGETALLWSKSDDSF